MDVSKECKSLQVLQNESCNDSSNPSDLDPDICSWNQKRYPQPKPFTFSAKLKPISQISPKSSPKPPKNNNPEKIPCAISINPILSHTPIPQIRNVSLGRSKKTHPKLKLPTPEPFPLKGSQESPKLIKYSNYLNSLAMRKLKIKQMMKTKDLSEKKSIWVTNSKMLEIFLKTKSPYTENRKSSNLQNKFELSTTKTLEELINSTRNQEISRRIYQQKFL